MSDRHLPRRSVGREALDRAIAREETRARRDVLELPRAETDPVMAELDPPLAAE